MSEKNMVLSLLEKGMSEAEIAQRINVAQPTVNRIKNGSGTSYTTGKALERLCADPSIIHKQRKETS